MLRSQRTSDPQKGEAGAKKSFRQQGRSEKVWARSVWLSKSSGPLSVPCHRNGPAACPGCRVSWEQPWGVVSVHTVGGGHRWALTGGLRGALCLQRCSMCSCSRPGVSSDLIALVVFIMARLYCSVFPIGLQLQFSFLVVTFFFF